MKGFLVSITLTWFPARKPRKECAMTNPLFTAKIWGCRGSYSNEPEEFLPRFQRLLKVLDPQQIEMVRQANQGVPLKEMFESFLNDGDQPRHHLYLDRGIHTTCIEVRCGDKIYVIDLGSGCVALGKKLIGGQLAKKSYDPGGGGRGSTLKFTVLGTHVHLDHLAYGAPFFGPFFVANELLNCEIRMFGGVDWWSGMDGALASAIEIPFFPLSIKQVMREKTVTTKTIQDGFEIIDEDEQGNKIRITAVKQNHPQETYGWRIEYMGKVFVFGGDNEPFPGFDRGCDPKLVKLCKEADVVVNDCQYSFDQYLGSTREKMSRRAWGHSFPEANAALVREAGVKGIFVTTHHDPGAETEWIEELARQVAMNVPKTVSVIAGFEGLELDMLNLSKVNHYAVSV